MLDRISDYLARNKALPVFFGVLLVILNYGVQFFAQAPVLGFAARTHLLLHLGIVVGLIGILVGDAL